MNYPVWDVAATGGGLLIAIVAIIHVFIAHFAVGGGFFLVLTEQKARREGDTKVLKYVASHTRFFLLLTMVAGALTGVGIWLTISAIHPGATSVMIHTFVFAWATEWAFFVVEIISLLLYYYTWDKVSGKTHLFLGWVYFIAAWMSLLLIDGIIAFMLTPGDWLETKSFWDGFFNPSFLPSLIFRTAIALTLAGIYGLITSSRLKDADLSHKLTRYCALWIAAPFIILAPSAWWYLEVIPTGARAMIMGGSADVQSFARFFLYVTPLVVLGGLAAIVRLPKGGQKFLAAALMVVGFLYLGSFEYIRETSRRPYIIHGYMYSNGILKEDLPKVREQGVLASAKWAGIKEITADNRQQAGRELFRLLCVSCHSIGGPRNDILVQAGKLEPEALGSVFDKMGKEKPSMPPFPGSNAEKEAILAWLNTTLPPKEAQAGQ